MIYLMDNYDIKKIIEENNKILKSIEKKLEQIENDIKTDIKPRCDKMDNHIDTIMDIYSSYKNPLDYLSSYFISDGSVKEIKNK